MSVEAEELEVVAVPEGEENADEQAEAKAETAVKDQTQQEDEGVVVSIGDEAPEAEEEASQAPAWVRELRKQNREDKKRIRELEQRLNEKASAPKDVVVGEEPTLEGCEFDEDRFKSEWKQWNKRQQEKEAKDREAADAAKRQQEAWNAKLENYGKQKAELKVSDFDDAEEAVKDALDVTQQGIIVQGASKSATLIYALGKNPAKLKELAAIKDPVQFAFAAANLEAQLKVTARKSAPPPEKKVSGSAPISGSVDSTLERLRAEAEKTGDMSKVMAYKRQLKNKQ